MDHQAYSTGEIFVVYEVEDIFFFSEIWAVPVWGRRHVSSWDNSSSPARLESGAVDWLSSAAPPDGADPAASGVLPHAWTPDPHTHTMLVTLHTTHPLGMWLIKVGCVCHATVRDCCQLEAWFTSIKFHYSNGLIAFIGCLKGGVVPLCGPLESLQERGPPGRGSSWCPAVWPVGPRVASRESAVQTPDGTWEKISLFKRHYKYDFQLFPCREY